MSAQAECDRANAAVTRLRRCKACGGSGHYTIVVKGRSVIGSGPCKACRGEGRR